MLRLLFNLTNWFIYVSSAILISMAAITLLKLAQLDHHHPLQAMTITIVTCAHGICLIIMTIFGLIQYHLETLYLFFAVYVNIPLAIGLSVYIMQGPILKFDSSNELDKYFGAIFVLEIILAYILLLMLFVPWLLQKYPTRRPAAQTTTDNHH